MITIEKVYRYKSLLISISYRCLHNVEASEDIAQEILIKASTRLNEFTSEEHCKAWLIRCTVNAVRNYVNSAHYRHSANSFDIDAIDTSKYVDNNLIAVDNVEKKCIQKEENALVRQAVEKLKTPYRDIITDYYFNDLSILEIAKKRGCPEGTIKAQLYRGRLRLRKILG